MPEISEVERWVIPAVLVVSVLGLVAALWWERVRPSVPPHVAELRRWQSMHRVEQAAVDAEVIERQAALEGAARLAVERASEINTLSHP